MPPRIDDDHAVAVVVVDRDVAVREPDRERGVIEGSPAESRAVAPEHAAVPVHDDRGSRSRVVREQDPAAGQHLRIRRIRHRRAYRPAQAAVRREVVDPRPLDLGDEHPAVPQRRVPVHGPERPGRIVMARSRPAELAHDPAGPDEQDATVVGVGDRERAVRQQVGVVRGVELVRPAPPHAGCPVEVHPVVRPDVDRDDRVGLLLVRHDRPAARLHEAVVVEVEVDAAGEVARGREAPEDAMPRVDEQHSIVPAVGDQQRARERPARGHRALSPGDMPRGRGRTPAGGGAAHALPQVQHCRNPDEDGEAEQDESHERPPLPRALRSGHRAEPTGHPGDRPGDASASAARWRGVGERGLETADQPRLLGGAQARLRVQQRVEPGRHRAAPDRLDDVTDVDVLGPAPLREVELAPSTRDVALDEPGDGRDVRVPAPVGLVAVAVEACVLRERAGSRGVPAGLGEHRWVRMAPPVGHGLDQPEQNEERHRGPQQRTSPADPSPLSPHPAILAAREAAGRRWRRRSAFRKTTELPTRRPGRGVPPAGIEPAHAV